MTYFDLRYSVSPKPGPISEGILLGSPGRRVILQRVWQLWEGESPQTLGAGAGEVAEWALGRIGFERHIRYVKERMRKR